MARCGSVTDKKGQREYLGFRLVGPRQVNSFVTPLLKQFRVHLRSIWHKF